MTRPARVTGDDRGVGLYQKYDVTRRGPAAAKHAFCALFVLDPDHDSTAREALRVYATGIRTRGWQALADDLDRILNDLDRDHPMQPGQPVAPRLTEEQRDQIHDREYPPGLGEVVDAGGAAVFAEFPGDSWREASLREVVGVVAKAAAPLLGAWEVAAAHVARMTREHKAQGWDVGHRNCDCDQEGRVPHQNPYRDPEWLTARG